MYIEIGIDNPSQWELVKLASLSFSGGKKKQNLTIQSQSWGIVYQREKMKQYPSKRICGNTRY